jgi:prepilin-type N-terminal cleavage/methylation domain-containing protein
MGEVVNMLNRKGFTLVELLAVIVIIAILSVAAVPAVLTISRNNKNNMFCKKVQTIVRSAQLYGEDVMESIDENEKVDDNVLCSIKEGNATVATIKKQCQFTTVLTLAEMGYVNYEQAGKSKVANEVLDPRNSQSMLNYKVMVYTVNKRVHAKFVYPSMQDALKCEKSIKVGNINVRELIYKDGTSIRRVSCDSKKLEDCKALTV